MRLIDTHSHLDVHHFDTDRHQLLAQARQAGVVAQVLPGVCQAWWPKLLELCRQEDDLFPAIGLHPMYLKYHHSDHLDLLAQHIARDNLVALGEIGLDFYGGKEDSEKQTELFTRQLRLAKNANLPVLLHVRKAHDQVQSIIRKLNFCCGGIIHAFSGSMQQALHYIQLGFMISFGGTVTYNRARRIRQVAKELPIEAIVVETDAPDIPPAAHHGQRNLPHYLPEVIQALSELRQEPMELLAEKTTINAQSILKLKAAP